MAKVVARRGAILNPDTAASRALSSKEIALPLKAGDVVRLESAGGGGWGDKAGRGEYLAVQDATEHYQ